MDKTVSIDKAYERVREYLNNVSREYIADTFNYVLDHKISAKSGKYIVEGKTLSPKQFDSHVAIVIDSLETHNIIKLYSDMIGCEFHLNNQGVLEETENEDNKRDVHA